MKFKISKDWIMKKALLEKGHSIEAGASSPLTREQWIARCIAQFRKAGVDDHNLIRQAAEAQLENCNNDTSESPEDAADDEMSHWAD